MRIVIVEDEIRIREGIHKLLEKTDPAFEIVGEAENGVTGAALVLREKPDLVLADIRMPEMDGIEMIRAVYEQNVKPMVIILSAYSDFGYAQQAMKLGVREYLLKPIVVDELISAVRRAQESVRQQLLARQGQKTLEDVFSAALYAGEIQSELLAYAHSEFGISHISPIALMLLKVISGEAALQDNAEKEIRRFAQESLPLRCIILPADAQGCIPAVFYGFDDGEKLCAKIEQNLLHDMCVTTHPVAQIGMCCGLEALSALAAGMQAQMEYGLIHPQGKLMRSDRLASIQTEMLSYPIEIESAARTALARRDYAGASARIRDFFRLFDGRGIYAPKDIKDTCIRFLLALLNTAHEVGVSFPGITRQSILSDVTSAVHPDQIIRIGSRFIATLPREEKKESRTGLLVRRAQSMMQEYYAQGITLEEIAQKLSVTPEYLGSQIHRETGMTFGMLMKILRVEHAKKLFLTTDKKLYEVARMVGYSDPKYFSKVFHSITGMLPQEYRRLNK